MIPPLFRKEAGFIALMSAIIISVVLLMVVTTSNFAGFYGRFNMLDAELKERSRVTADACADVALLKLRENLDPSGLGVTLNELDRCQVGSVSGTTEKTFTVQAMSSRAVTNLQIIVKASDFSVLSWREISTF